MRGNLARDRIKLSIEDNKLDPTHVVQCNACQVDITFGKGVYFSTWTYQSFNVCRDMGECQRLTSPEVGTATPVNVFLDLTTDPLKVKGM